MRNQNIPLPDCFEQHSSRCSLFLLFFFSMFWIWRAALDKNEVLRTFLWGDITHRCNVAAYLLKGVLLHDHTVLICIREVVCEEKFLKSRRKEETYILSLSRTELCNSKCPGAGHGGDSSRRSHYHSPSRSPLLPYARTHLYIACIHVRFAIFTECKQSYTLWSDFLLVHERNAENLAVFNWFICWARYIVKSEKHKFKHIS